MKCDYKLLGIVLIFVLGLYYYINSSSLYENMENVKNVENVENVENKSEPTKKSFRCPNMLIEKDGAIYLYNSKLAIVPGVNPIKFDKLEEYAEFVEWQKSQNIDCPILYLQYTTDTQNNELLQIKPSIFENQGGLPSQTGVRQGENTDEYYEQNKILDATKDSTPNSDIKFNSNMLMGYDQHNQNVGLDTPLDKLYHERSETSANPMDPHWGGKKYTKSKVSAGNYQDRYVYKHPQ